MSAEAVEFPVEAVRRHAGSVDLIAADVEQARAAVGEVAMDTQAYGLLCQFLPGLLTPVFAVAASALSDCAGALHDTAGELRAAAAGTEATDVASARRLRATAPPSTGMWLPL
jgi:Excreted virulence factor EspC, type VII ESX diderm